METTLPVQLSKALFLYLFGNYYLCHHIYSRQKYVLRHEIEMVSCFFVDIVKFAPPLESLVSWQSDLRCFRSPHICWTPGPCLVGSLVALLGQILQTVKLPHTVNPYRSLLYAFVAWFPHGKLKLW